jgi:hypothetical protein
MRLRGFQLLGIYLTVADKSFDLHNNFNFTGFAYEIGARTLRLNWKRGAGAWVPSTDPLDIQIDLLGISHFSASPRVEDRPYTDDECLDCVSFVESSQHIDESFTTAATPADDWHYVFQFESGLVIRVKAEEATCHID